LSPAIRQELDLGTLQVDSASYVDDQLKEHFADLAFQCRLKDREETVEVVILLEHKSYPEEYLHFQLLRYQLNVWEKQVKSKEKPTPVVVLVVYHGQTAWRLLPFRESFGPSWPDAVRDTIPDVRYEVLNLTREEIAGIQATYDHLLVQQALLLLKHIYSNQLDALLPLIFGPAGLDKKDQQVVGFLRIFEVYILKTGKMNKEVLDQTLKEFWEDWDFEPGSVGEQMVLESHEKGLSLGEERNLRRNVLTMFKKGFSVLQIADILDLTEAEVRSICEG
jgi:hypothetical protein